MLDRTADRLDFLTGSGKSGRRQMVLQGLNVILQNSEERHGVIVGSGGIAGIVLHEQNDVSFNGVGLNCSQFGGAFHGLLERVGFELRTADRILDVADRIAAVIVGKRVDGLLQRVVRTGLGQECWKQAFQPVDERCQTVLCAILIDTTSLRCQRFHL